jgi:hypothetical protein
MTGNLRVPPGTSDTRPFHDEVSPDQQIRSTVDLLRSLQRSIARLRGAAEYLADQLEAEAELPDRSADVQIRKLITLIADCQKVETLLVSQSAEFARLFNAGNQLDLSAARAEIESRLACLRALVSDADAAG